VQRWRWSCEGLKVNAVAFLLLGSTLAKASARLEFLANLAHVRAWALSESIAKK
jgi:hypothetical protein